MDLQYLKVLEEYKINEKELPEDAKNGIKEIKTALKFAKLRESKGHDASAYYTRIKTFDKWVTLEIGDFINGTDDNEEMPEIENEQEDEN